METATDSATAPSSHDHDGFGLRCRFCEAPLQHTFVDLGLSPLCESYVPADRLNHGEAFYPLHVFVCEECFLVQLDEYVSREEIFTEYAYFSSYADSWLEHAKRYVDMITDRLGLDADSQVVELASNDGYLLQYFVEKDIPALGIEPAENVAQAASKRASTRGSSSSTQPQRATSSARACRPTSSSETTSWPRCRT